MTASRLAFRIAASLIATSAHAASGVYDAAALYGVGPAVVDNGPLINSAEAYCFAQGGGTITLPQGILNTETSIQEQQGCRLKGAGRGLPYFGLPTPPPGVTVLHWTGSPMATAVVMNAGWGTNANWNIGVEDLTIDGAATTPGAASIDAISLNGSSYGRSMNVDCENVRYCVDITNNSEGNVYTAFNQFIGMNAVNVYDVIFFGGGTNNYIDMFVGQQIGHIGIEFYGNADSNQIGHAWITLYSVANDVTGLAFNTSNPSGPADIYSETIDYLYIGMGPGTGQKSVVQNYSADGGSNSITHLEIASPYDADPIIGSGGYLTYEQVYNGSIVGRSFGSPVVFNGAIPTIDPLYCNNGGGAVVRNGSTNNSGRITVGAASTACVVGFALTAPGVGWYPMGTNAIDCTYNDLSGPRVLWGTPPNNLGFTVKGLNPGDTFSYHCF